MFPTPASGGNRPDPNRDYHYDPESGRPRSLDVAYWLLVAGAVLCAVAGLMLLTTDVPQEVVDWNAEHAENVRSNMRFVAWFNLVGALLVGLCAPQVRAGSRVWRRWVAALLVLLVVGNMIALVAKVVGPAVLLSLVVFAAAAVAMFRPDANGYIRHHSGVDTPGA